MTGTMGNTGRELLPEVWLLLPGRRLWVSLLRAVLQLCRVSLFLAHLHIRLEVMQQQNTRNTRK